MGQRPRRGRTARARVVRGAGSRARPRPWLSGRRSPRRPDPQRRPGDSARPAPLPGRPRARRARRGATGAERRSRPAPVSGRAGRGAGDDGHDGVEGAVRRTRHARRERRHAGARSRRGRADPGRGDAVTPQSVQAAVEPVAEGVFHSPLARVKRVMPFLGPAFVASVAYMDPGNFATNIQAGADYGYMLLWVLLLSNLMALLIQSLSAKLGIASGMTLPQAIRMHTSRRMRIGLWLAAEAAAMGPGLGR